jgi:hypothetical protein
MLNRLPSDIPDLWHDIDPPIQPGWVIETDGADQQVLTEYRYRAEPEALGGSPIGETTAERPPRALA